MVRYLLLLLITRASCETLSHQREEASSSGDGGVVLSVDRHADVELRRPHTVMRREQFAESDGTSLQQGQRQAVGYRRSGSGYTLWSNVSGLTGKLCAHGNHTNKTYEKHIKDTEAESLERCQSHCQATLWCSALSYHSEANVCVIVAAPCVPLAGPQSSIAGATDENWITMSSSEWPELGNMNGQHCDTSKAGQTEMHTNAKSLTNCMTKCNGASWCKAVSYETATNICNLVEKCQPADDASDSLGYDVFSKSV